MIRNTKGQFTSETHLSLTEEERILRSNALRAAAKRKPGYIGDIKDECPRVFNSWRAIRFSEYGKKVGCSKDWGTFRDFYNDVRPGYEKGKILRRKDSTKPWSPDNFMWTTAEEDASTRARVFLEYNGEVKTLREWADELNLTYNQIRLRYARAREGSAVEEILFGKKKKRDSKTPKDHTDPNVEIRAKASKMISSYRHKDMENGTERSDIDIDWMIENILTKPCHYCGDIRRVGCDRIDNSRGHTKDNVVPCCIECNTARNKFFTYEEMRRLGRAIAEIKKDRQL